MTRRYVTIGNVSRMDARLETLREPWERVMWARMRWQEKAGIRPNATAAAESLGMKQHTYKAYERPETASKHTDLDHTRAVQFGRKFGVSWRWLLSGEGSPDDQSIAELTPIESRIIDAVRAAPEARRTAVADAIEQLLKSG